MFETKKTKIEVQKAQTFQHTSTFFSNFAHYRFQKKELFFVLIENEKWMNQFTTIYSKIKPSNFFSVLTVKHFISITKLSHIAE